MKHFLVWADFVTAAVICVVIALIVLIIIYTKRPQKSNFTEYYKDPEYSKELQLFKSMNLKEQIDYLNMSKEHKLSQYKSMLQ